MGVKKKNKEEVCGDVIVMLSGLPLQRLRSQKACVIDLGGGMTFDRGGCIPGKELETLHSCIMGNVGFERVAQIVD